MPSDLFAVIAASAEWVENPSEMAAAAGEGVVTGLAADMAGEAVCAVEVLSTRARQQFTPSRICHHVSECRVTRGAHLVG